MSNHALSRDIAIARRVGCRMGLLDLEGRLSARAEGGQTVFVTPGPAAAEPLRLAADELLEVDLDGKVVMGDPERVPPDFTFDLAVYRARPDVGAIAVGSSPTAMAFGSVGRDVLPLTHTWAEYAHAGTVWLPHEAIGTTNQEADDLAALVPRESFAHVPGVAVYSFGEEPLDALRRLDAFEYLARLTAVATALDPRPRTVTREEVVALSSQRPTERRPSRDYRRYYRSLEPSMPRAAVGSDTADATQQVRNDVAAACRVLAAAGDLVAFFEHVSHRIPGFPDRFAMSPAKDFSTMEPEDIGIVSSLGECDPIDGPYPPAPFRWYHRDLLERRPDVNAIVHTHELAGRAVVLAGARPPITHRYATLGMLGEYPPVFPVPSLIFSDEHRREMLDLLGAGPWVHSVAHGTDYCAADIATATVRAVHRERHLRHYVLARSLGEPRALDGGTVERLRRTSPGHLAWWRYYKDEVTEPSPRPT